MDKTKVLLFGTGPMAYEYAKVLKAQGYKFIVVGRGQDSATNFRKKTGITPFIGGAVKFLSTDSFSSYKAIVAVTGDQLGSVTISLIKHGIKSILVEKPGGLDQEEIQHVRNEAKRHAVEIFIAYNRRFYSSVITARGIIKEDGGILSYHFEFNEPGYKIAQLEDSIEIKNNWLLHNSSHVIDLAFFIENQPKLMNSQISGSLSWHPAGAIFTGSGISKTNTPFTYHANWLTPGRWGLEFMTKNYRLIFRPMEKLHVQKNDSFEIMEVKIDDKLDRDFKPGLYKEVESFINGQRDLCTIDEQFEHLKWYTKILKGS
ncbi:hypothetical protein A3C59_00400 [Candidatus Daviesbacteria bacterium RIFCSPHIGHO2_02_FULL_36_13]|uniref:Gfo/Idh/MocA-like oxidoreductase N-terminal domain-containing protein n=1 Tax=Candidatus Daviesbacteria bacterium RIFCSPHIGHO2_02_FULL_36_13 TaxID=1797768 RepID=A0A1F5JP76_9BACT|nr:MAG: hypothetical protein A3C59_00400 [Candidatus Daviesbacteria bacterium RIFCSPHIGHO2_02_FULL_36_13]OGE43779.1 MAG: hypothetical protein A3A45_00300 [Candidatus Daviesbacteria bacterium RIFCSPLOWO2_01_FULL_36_8]